MRKRVIFSWLIFLLLVIIIASMAPAGLARIYFLNGKRHFASCEYQKAVDDYQHAIRFSPKFARAYVELGDTYRELQRYEEAAEAFKKAMRIEDESCASCGLGVTYYKSGRYEDAENAFKRAIELDPNDVCAYDWSGRMYYELSRYHEAVEVFKQEIRLQPNASAYLFLGNAYVYSRQFNEGVNAYKQALHLNPDELAYYQLGVAYDGLNQYGEAIEAYHQAIKIKPSDEKAHYGLGVAYLATGDKRSALEQYEILQTLDPNWAAKLQQQSPSLQGRESAKEKLYFVPLGSFSAPPLRELISYYKRKSGISIVSLPALPLEPATFDAHRHQLIAEDLVELIKRSYPKLAQDPNATLIGLTEKDMYIREKSWQFAFSYRVDGRFAVVSSARMNPVNLGEPANAELLRSRVRKMIMKNIGLLYYQMPLSNNPKSVLYNNILGLEELDNVSEDF
jgi:tetratricopeptide (TPR) repeat protein